MPGFMTLSQKVRWAVRYCPLILPSILNDPHLDKTITRGMLHDLIPRRTSLEIECLGGILANTNIPCYSIKTGRLLNSGYPTDADIERYYNLYSFVSDKTGLYHASQLNEIKSGAKTDGEGGYNEHRISIKGYSQLVGLYKILEDMKEYCVINKASGIHIHLDIRKTAKLPGYSEQSINKFFTNKCGDGSITKLFTIKGNCHPTSDDHKYYAKCYCRHNWIANRCSTLEFRTAPQTFEYSIIVNWIITLNKWLNQFEYLIRNTTSKIATANIEKKCEVEAEVREEVGMEHVYVNVPSSSVPFTLSFTQADWDNFVRSVSANEIAGIRRNC